jgi:hypothetical protein
MKLLEPLSLFYVFLIHATVMVVVPGGTHVKRRSRLTTCGRHKNPAPSLTDMAALEIPFLQKSARLMISRKICKLEQIERWCW